MLALSGSEHYHMMEHGGMGRMFIHVGSGNRMYDIMGFNGLICVIVESKFDCLILIFPKHRHVNQFPYVSFSLLCL